MSDTETFLLNMLAQVLEVEQAQLSPLLTLDEQGLDSLMSLRLLRRIQQRSDVEIDPEWLLEYRTVRELAECLDAKAGLCHTRQSPSLKGCP